MISNRYASKRESRRGSAFTTLTILSACIAASAVPVFATPAQAASFQGASSTKRLVAEVLSRCPGAAALTYVGSGSDKAEQALLLEQQQVAPMSRDLGAALTCQGPLPGEAEGLLLGLDAVTIAASLASVGTCTTGLIGGTTFPVEELNGIPQTQCPGCVAGEYTLEGWQDALRMVFLGMPHGAGADLSQRDCNSDVRHTLVQKWSALFGTACTSGDCTKLELPSHISAKGALSDHPVIHDDLNTQGSFELALTVGGAAVNSVSYEISRPGFRTLAGAIDVSDPFATVSAYFGGLPAVPGCNLQLKSSSADGLTTCEGQATFEVFVGLTTALTIRMDCRQFNNRGGIAVSVTTNFCPRIKLLVISPTEAGFGKRISLNATVEDPDGPIPALLWTATGGSFRNTALPVTNYTCTRSGLQTLNLVISDAQCTDSMTAKVNCLPCGKADVDKNGVFDCEESLIKNGEFRVDTAS